MRGRGVGVAACHDDPSGPSTVTVTFSDIVLRGCNALAWGYELDGVAHDVDDKANMDCAEVPGTPTTVVYRSNQILRVYLKDNTCSDTYFEDGNHGAVTGANPFLIRIADSGGFCERGADVSWTPVGDEPAI